MVGRRFSEAVATASNERITVTLIWPGKVISLGDLGRDLARQLDHGEVVDVALADVDPQLAAAVDRVGAIDAAVATPDALEILDLGRRSPR